MLLRVSASDPSCAVAERVRGSPRGAPTRRINCPVLPGTAVFLISGAIHGTKEKLVNISGHQSDQDATEINARRIRPTVLRRAIGIRKGARSRQK